MTWQGIVGHDHLVELFRRSIEQKKLATTFLFVGPQGIGKRTFALKLAQSILCGTVDESELSPCGTCSECQQVLSDSHPDLQLIQKPADKSFIPVDTFIGDRDHRMRSGLCHFMSLTPSGGKRRVAIIDDADWLNQEGANSLLKTLEEPSPGAIIILISTSVQRQLPTIRSRSQVVRFKPLADEEVAECLLRQNLAETQEQAVEMATRADGSLFRAVALADETVAEFRRELWAELAKPTIDRSGLAKCLNEFAEAAGKDTPVKRRQLRLAFDSAIDFYRALARFTSDNVVSSDRDLQSVVQTIMQREGTRAEVAVSQLDRCIDAIGQVNSNANLGILVDAWVCDLAVMTRTQQPMISAYS